MGENEGVHAKTNFQCKVTCGVLLTFLPAYSLHNDFLESP